MHKYKEQLKNALLWAVFANLPPLGAFLMFKLDNLFGVLVFILFMLLAGFIYNFAIKNNENSVEKQKTGSE